jgi:hypothetical protein
MYLTATTDKLKVNVTKSCIQTTLGWRMVIYLSDISVG